MVTKPRKLKKAESRDGMRGTTIWLPTEVYEALALARIEDGRSANEMIRTAVMQWLAQRKQRRRKRRANT